MSTGTTTSFRWHDGKLEELDDHAPAQIIAADSWLVTAGAVLAIDLHRERFLRAVSRREHPELDVAGFWDAMVSALPRDGDWFPRVELENHNEGMRLTFRLRPAPERTLSARLATHPGADPRTEPRVKGPDTQVLLGLRTEAQRRGADEAVIVSPDGFIIEGSGSAILWWRGNVLCAPSLELERVDSVTAKSLIALSGALGIEVHYESARPMDLDGFEVWSLSALHGIRIVRSWVAGPGTAEQPGRLAVWRAGMDRLRKPLPESSRG